MLTSAIPLPTYLASNYSSGPHVNIHGNSFVRGLIYDLHFACTRLDFGLRLISDKCELGHFLNKFKYGIIASVYQS
jgi:hypothetical protein